MSELTQFQILRQRLLCLLHLKYINETHHQDEEDLLPTFGPLTTKSGAFPNNLELRVFIPKLTALALIIIVVNKGTGNTIKAQLTEKNCSSLNALSSSELVAGLRGSISSLTIARFKPSGR